MSDTLKETKKARLLLQRKQDKLRKLGYESFMSGLGIRKTLEAKDVSKVINMINTSIEQQESSYKLPQKFRPENDAVKKDFIFSLYSKE